MFRLIIQQTNNCVRQQTRNAGTHRYRRNNGIRRQVKAGINDIEQEMSLDDDLSKYEGNFSNTTDTYEEHQQETRMERENLKRNIVRSKYFKENNLSFLTWAEMEQIQFLHKKDSEEWSEENLAESFPADVSTIRKILKRNWQPRNAERIVKYDEKVQQNWKAFLNGEITFSDPKLKEHLKKFSMRNLNQKVDYDYVFKKEMPKPQGTEFLGIITSCKKYIEEPKKDLLQQSLDGNHMALEQPIQSAKLFSKKIEPKKFYTFKSDDVDEAAPVLSRDTEIVFNNPTGTGVKKHNKPVDFVEKYEKNEVQLSEIDRKQLTVSPIRERIDIPPKLFKEGATYRLEDCYYDDDGEFLYRVPGMTKC